MKITNHPPIPPGYRQLLLGEIVHPGDKYTHDNGQTWNVQTETYVIEDHHSPTICKIVPDLAPKAEAPVEPYFWLPLTGESIEAGDEEINHVGFSPQWIPARNVGGFVPWCGFIRRRVPTMASEGLNDDGSKMATGELDPSPQVVEKSQEERDEEAFLDWNRSVVFPGAARDQGHRRMLWHAALRHARRLNSCNNQTGDELR